MRQHGEIKVLHVQKAAGIGGSERHLLILLPALAEAGVEVRMCVALAGDGELFADALRARGVDTVTTSAGPDVNPRLVAALRREIRGWGPDVVHTHLVHADLHGHLAGILTRTPRLSTVHGPGAFARSRPSRAATRMVGMLVPSTIAISNDLRSMLERSGQRRSGSVRVVHYGLDTAGWEASEAERDDVRQGLALGADEVAAAICARLIPGKGHELLLDAVARARERAPNLRLLVAGDGPLRDQVERRAAQLPPGTVRLLGFVDDVRGVMAAADVLAFPTSPQLGEGFGLAALEAMAVGRAVVATRVGALPEVVDDGRTGVLVPPDDPASLADALVELATQPALRLQLGSEGRVRAEAEFSVGRMVEGTLAAYRETLARASR